MPRSSRPAITEAARGIFFPPEVVAAAEAILRRLGPGPFMGVHLRIEGDWPKAWGDRVRAGRAVGGQKTACIVASPLRYVCRLLGAGAVACLPAGLACRPAAAGAPKQSGPKPYGELCVCGMPWPQDQMLGQYVEAMRAAGFNASSKVYAASGIFAYEEPAGAAGLAPGPALACCTQGNVAAEGAGRPEIVLAVLPWAARATR